LLGDQARQMAAGMNPAAKATSDKPRRGRYVGKRHQARELALRVLFQLESSGDEPDEVLAYHAGEGAAPPDVTGFAAELVRGVLANQERLDEIIGQASEHWKLDQMAKVDRIILRIAVFELAIERQVPTKAAINESIELARTFSGDDSGRFINGVLGRVAASSS
jgi:transcription antitermination protein NusB